MTAPELSRALEATSEIRITVTGRRSGREVSHPVWFVREDDDLYLIPVRGAATGWYRNVLADPTIRIAANGAEATASATTITDPAAVADIAHKFDAKYGEVDRYYPVREVAVRVPLG
jgi:deazaflavin-dependent oxidoreductase (nitroreductase family)